MLKAIHSYKIIASLVRKKWLIIKRILHIFEILIMWTHFDLSTQINLLELQSLDPRTM
jgi:hypothetical protein